MTVVYWVAAAVAVACAAEAAGELARDRSPALAAWALSMMATGASLAVAAAVPAVLRGGSAWAGPACAGAGIAGTWAFAEVLAAGNGDGHRLAGMMAIPVLGGGCAAVLLLGLRWAGGHGGGGGPVMAIVAQLTLVAYYAPGLCRIAFLARRRAGLMPPSWSRVAMRAAGGSASAEVVLVMARSVAAVASACGMRAGEPAITVTGVLQGIAATCGIGALAAGPVVMLASARCGPWLAYWRLRPLWAVVREAVPDGGLPAWPRGRPGIRWRLLRRVIEIRDAEYALGPYRRADVAARALATARSAALGADLEQAVVEAAVLVNAAACHRGVPAPRGQVPAQVVYPGTDEFLRSEVARLVLVSWVIRRCPVVREL